MGEIAVYTGRQSSRKRAVYAKRLDGCSPITFPYSTTRTYTAARISLSNYGA